ncbi:hypothetical protein [Chromobacterium amazonense]|uniref:hypothetical protein n=1 Tax=Chromobacterium amazonense TaxID=1382803 RepID=UPI003F7AFD21
MQQAIQGYALRAHLALDSVKADISDTAALIELSCYIEAAWQGSCLAFKSPPKRLASAKDILVAYLNDTDALPPLSSTDWTILCAGITCADGVWERLPDLIMLTVMQRIKDNVLELPA